MISATSPSALPYLARDGGGEAVGRDAAALHVVGGEERREGLGVGGGVDADDLDGLGGLVDRLAERGALGRRDHDGGRLAGDGVLEDRDLAVDVGLGLGAELRHLDAEILAGLAGAGEHDLPVEGGRVLDDDGNGGLLGVGGGDEADGRCDQPGDEPGFLHGCFLNRFWRPAPCRSRFSHIRSRPAVSRPGSRFGKRMEFFFHS